MLDESEKTITIRPRRSAMPPVAMYHNRLAFSNEVLANWKSPKQNRVSKVIPRKAL